MPSAAPLAPGMRPSTMMSVAFSEQPRALTTMRLTLTTVSTADDAEPQTSRRQGSRLAVARSDTEVRAVFSAGIPAERPGAEACYAGPRRRLSSGCRARRHERAVRHRWRVSCRRSCARLAFELRVDDLGVGRAAVDERDVTAPTDDAAVFDDDDLVGVGDGRHALRHDQHSGVPDVGLQGQAEAGVGGEVERGERVIEDVDVRAA